MELPKITDNSIWLHQGGPFVSSIKGIRHTEIYMILYSLFLANSWIMCITNFGGFYFLLGNVR